MQYIREACRRELSQGTSSVDSCEASDGQEVSYHAVSPSIKRVSANSVCSAKRAPTQFVDGSQPEQQKDSAIWPVHNFTRNYLHIISYSIK
jgi:hypothetical protein